MERKAFSIIPALVIIAVALFSSQFAKAQSVPQLINYQGRLTDSGGAPLNGETVDMRFAFLDGDTSTATELWGETQLNVLVTGGIYNVILGSVEPILPSALSGATVFLEVKVDG